MSYIHLIYARKPLSCRLFPLPSPKTWRLFGVTAGSNFFRGPRGWLFFRVKHEAAFQKRARCGIDARAARRNRRRRVGHVHHGACRRRPARYSRPPGVDVEWFRGRERRCAALPCPTARPAAGGSVRPAAWWMRRARDALGSSDGRALDAAGASRPGVVRRRARSTCLHAASLLLLNVARRADRMRDRWGCSQEMRALLWRAVAGRARARGAVPSGRRARRVEESR